MENNTAVRAVMIEKYTRMVQNKNIRKFVLMRKLDKIVTFAKRNHQMETMNALINIEATETQPHRCVLFLFRNGHEPATMEMFKPWKNFPHCENKNALSECPFRSSLQRISNLEHVQTMEEFLSWYYLWKNRR